MGVFPNQVTHINVLVILHLIIVRLYRLQIYILNKINSFCAHACVNGRG